MVGNIIISGHFIIFLAITIKVLAISIDWSNVVNHRMFMERNRVWNIFKKHAKNIFYWVILKITAKFVHINPILWPFRTEYCMLSKGLKLFHYSMCFLASIITIIAIIKQKKTITSSVRHDKTTWARRIYTYSVHCTLIAAQLFALYVEGTKQNREVIWFLPVFLSFSRSFWSYIVLIILIP